MINFKKILSIFLCLVMLSSVVLTSCDSGNDAPVDTSTESSDTTKDDTSSLLSKLMSQTLTVNGTSVSGRVSYATEVFSFINDISVTNNGTWVLSTDAYGINTIITKTAPLSVGDNLFYIHVENPDKTVTIEI